MRYETPEIQEIGEAAEEIKIERTDNPDDFEPSTGWMGHIDPLSTGH